MSNDKDKDNDKGKPENGGNDFVTITVNNVQVKIHRGRQSVSAIKTAGQVDQVDALDQVIDGKLVGLPDDGAVTIKGGEGFISHHKDNSSS
jgi:hypothetical protein